LGTTRPVVVSASGAMPGIVERTGLVVPKRDPGALAGAVTRLLDDPLLGARLGRAARVRARERYGLERYVDRVVALYDSLVPAAASRAA
jgi:glycosyltransferase involved in cell wall biosynthesis